MQVDLDGAREAELRPARFDDRAVGRATAPQRGAQRGVRALLRDVEPERAGDVHALLGPAADREECDQPLRARRQLDGLVAGVQLEPPSSDNRSRPRPPSFGAGVDAVRSRIVTPVMKPIPRNS